MSDPVLTLKLTPDAVEALSLACTWFRGEIYKAYSGLPLSPAVSLLYQHMADEFGEKVMHDMMRMHATKLGSLEAKLTMAHEQICEATA